MSIRIVPPTQRVCTQCGRQDRWDVESENWVIDTVEDEHKVGNPSCIHEWDINGTYNPVREA